MESVSSAADDLFGLSLHSVPCSTESPWDLHAQDETSNLVSSPRASQQQQDASDVCEEFSSLQLAGSSYFAS